MFSLIYLFIYFNYSYVIFLLLFLCVVYSFAQIEVEESLTITDHKGNEQGHLQVNKKFLSSLY